MNAIVGFISVWSLQFLVYYIMLLIKRASKMAKLSYYFNVAASSHVSIDN